MIPYPTSEAFRIQPFWNKVLDNLIPPWGDHLTLKRQGKDRPQLAQNNKRAPEGRPLFILNVAGYGK
jgi:hypothetical protein